MVSSLANLIGIEEMKNYLHSVLKSIMKSPDFHLDFILKESNGISGYFMEFTIRNQKFEQHIHLPTSEKSKFAMKAMSWKW